MEKILGTKKIPLSCYCRIILNCPTITAISWLPPLISHLFHPSFLRLRTAWLLLCRYPFFKLQYTLKLAHFDAVVQCSNYVLFLKY